KACVLPENPASYRVVRTKSYLFNKAVDNAQTGFYPAADRSSSIHPKIVPLHYRYDLQAAGSQASESVLLKLFCSLT
ncbi:hypothetical protein ACPEMX_21335, partial [Klebsiella quasipneumoniae]